MHNTFDVSLASNPALANVTPAAIQQALNCSPRYASRIRRGAVIPHPMHYAALERLITA